MRYVNCKMFFWGERLYIQGTHQVYALLNVANSLGIYHVKNISAVFKKPLLGNCRFAIGEGDRIDGWCTKVVLTSSSKKHTVYVLPEDDVDCDRIADDEASLVLGSVVDVESKCIELKDYDPLRILTVFTSLNKIMLSTLLPSKKYGPWLLAQLDCSWPAYGSPLVVRLDRNVGGRMVSSSIFLSGYRVGCLKFIREPIS